MFFQIILLISEYDSHLSQFRLLNAPLDNTGELRVIVALELGRDDWCTDVLGGIHDLLDTGHTLRDVYTQSRTVCGRMWVPLWLKDLLYYLVIEFNYSLTHILIQLHQITPKYKDFSQQKTQINNNFFLILPYFKSLFQYMLETIIYWLSHN